MKKIRAICFGLQGFGNDLIKGLADNQNVEITAVYTRKNSYPFDYYDCELIEELSEAFKIPVHHIKSDGEWECKKADLGIISSFHRILNEHHLEKFEHVINIHPSLLPNYKGATPTNWMVRNKEQIVGLTAHLVKENVDSGPILFQRKLLNPYLEDNRLRKALSFLVEEVLDDIIDAYPNFKAIKTKERGSYQSPRSEQDAIIELEKLDSIEDLIFHIKAFTNYPMPKIRLENKLFEIDYENPSESIEIELEGKAFNLLGKWILED